jgi:putative ABC transport system permease protein
MSLSSFVGDLRFAFRLMARGPGLTTILVLTLALGIGASTTIFSVVNSVLLKPLPYKEPERLVRVYTEFVGKTLQFRKFWVSPPEYNDLARDCRSCETTAAWARGTASLSGGDRPVRVEAGFATHTLLPMLGVAPLHGRFFDASEDVKGDPRVVILGYDLWRRAFGGDPAAVGKQVTLDAMPVTIIGVMPPGFDFLDRLDAWAPLGLDPNAQNRGSHFLEVVIRLQRGVDITAFRSEIEALKKQWGAVRINAPDPQADNLPHAITPEQHPIIALPLQEDIVGGMASSLWLLQFAALFVLLIAIVNIANLLLARSETRSREIAVRHALGAGRRRLIRQFLTESLVLGGLGGGLGILAAVWALDGILAVIPRAAPRVGEIGLDGGAVLFAVACSIAASLVFGLAPILHARKTDIHTALKDGSPRMTGSRGQLRVRKGLVIVEIALAVVLVVGCAVMVKSFVRLQEVDLGFEPDHLFTAEIELPAKTYPGDGVAATSFWRRLQDRLTALPGVKSATLVSGIPPSRRLNANDMGLPGRPKKVDDVPGNVDYWNASSDGLLETMGMRLVKGRALGPTDSEAMPGVVMVNERFANRFWPGEDPIGKQIQLTPWMDDKAKIQTVVGVVADVKQMGIDRPAGTEVFFSLWQAPAQLGGETHNTMSLVVRTHGDPNAIGPAVQQVVQALDPTLPVSKMRTMDDVVWEGVARPRFITVLLTAFAAMALLLAAVGIYGVMAHNVAQRTHEIGVRVALGAQPRQVRWMVLRQAGVLVLIGVAIGVVGAVALQLALDTELAGVLYGESLLRPALLVGVAVVVLLAAALATWIPARRATRVQPTVALRTE